MDKHVVGWPDPAFVVILTEWIRNLVAILLKTTSLSIKIYPPCFNSMQRLTASAIQELKFQNFFGTFSLKCTNSTIRVFIERIIITSSSKLNNKILMKNKIN